MVIERAKQRLAQHQSGLLSSRLASEWDRQTDLSVGFSHRTNETCPACGHDGTLEGDDVQNSEIKYEQVGAEDFDAWAELSIGADYFSCSRCRLVLDGYELLEAAGVSLTFEATGDASEYMEAEYGND